MLLAPNASNICCWRPLAATSFVGGKHQKHLLLAASASYNCCWPIQ
jgi:hypothetical protein